MNKMLEIQQRLHVHKGQSNSFGGYNYRTSEDILRSIKPILKELDCTILRTDSIELVGEMVFVCTTATIYDADLATIGTAKGYAMHEATKKGMDGAQITGAASSYASKRAMANLCGIDNEKEADSTNVGPRPQEQPPRGTAPARPAAPAKEPLLGQPTVTRDQGAQIKQAREAAGLSTDEVFAMMKEPPFCCEKPPSDLLSIHVPTLISRIEAKMEGK